MQFFKRIRRRLIVSKRLKEYLLYATGEIVLVVIGILIALAIDTGIQRRALRATEREYLAGLREEFRLSRLKLDELMRVNRSNYAVGCQLANYLHHSRERPSEQELADLLYRTFASDIAFHPNNSLLLEIINSGRMQHLSDARLRVMLTNWIATLTDVAQQESDLYTQREKVVDLLRGPATSVRTVFDLTGVSDGELGLTLADRHVSNLEMMNSAAFENGLLLFLLTTRATDLQHYVPLRVQLEAILKQLDRKMK